MTRTLLPLLRRFGRREDGTVAPEVALWMPIFLLLIISSMELGIVTIRHTVLERALDQTVRDVKLGIGPTTHAQMKAAICARARILPECAQTLHLEMIPLDINNWAQPAAAADCVDLSEPVTPQRHFVNGQGGQIMFLRACYKFRPVTPIGSLNASLNKDGEGYTGLVSTSAFVNEPS
ncbi:pilus assembly protein [Sagittula sp. NFXS13]|uniref:TadE-like domain-containing protein n=2 Tax=Sagittula marina TaxID=943940 RepID=A0A7W6DU23_9RHOB|nr:hypothetical protein [Sagittula marina]